MVTYLVYKTTNLTDGRFYIGVHKTRNPGDRYLGSGVWLLRALKKYGRSAFRRETLFEFRRARLAYSKEKELIAAAKSGRCYNLADGGRGGWSHVWNLPQTMATRIRNGKRATENPSPALLEAQKMRSPAMRRYWKRPTALAIKARRKNGRSAGRLNLVKANFNPSPKMVEIRKNKTPKMRAASRRNMKTLNANPTESMKEAQRRAGRLYGIENLRKANAARAARRVGALSGTV